MKKSQITNHLELALTGDEKHLKEKIGKLYKVLTRQTGRQQNVARRKLKFVQTDNRTWQVILDRDDAKNVEEIVFDFLDRKQLDGRWKIETDNFGKPVPTWRISRTFCFTFKLIPEKQNKAKREKPAEKPTVTTVLNKINTLSKEDREALLKAMGR